MNLYLKKQKAYEAAGKSQILTDRKSQSRSHSSGYRYQRFTVSRKWKFFWTVTSDGK